MTAGGGLSGHPHQGQPVYQAGASLTEAQTALILLHGRGASGPDILGLGQQIGREDTICLAPQAAGASWYPQPFSAPLEQNEPWLSSALEVVAGLVSQLNAAGIPPRRCMLVGFSQGACLALEYAARNPARYGGLAGLSGALVGPAGLARAAGGSFEDTPLLLGVSESDPYIPLERVTAAQQHFDRQGAAVTLRVYPGGAHTVFEDELDWLRQAISAL